MEVIPQNCYVPLFLVLFALVGGKCKESVVGLTIGAEFLVVIWWLFSPR